MTEGKRSGLEPNEYGDDPRWVASWEDLAARNSQQSEAEAITDAAIETGDTQVQEIIEGGQNG